MKRSRRLIAGMSLLAILVSMGGARAVVNGQPADDGEYPFMTAIYTGTSPRSGQYCGGSLVHARYVVTAAHCVFGLLDNTVARLPVDLLGLKVKALIGRRTLNGSGGESIVVRFLASNPDRASDIAVLELERDSVYQPIAIADPSHASFQAPGTMATVTGWGATQERGSGSNELLEAEVPIVSDADCSTMYSGRTNPAYEICAGYPEGETDTCQGDSGGPLMVPGPGNAWLLVGVTSWGEGCARPNRPGVYAEVAPASEFIRSFFS